MLSRRHIRIKVLQALYSYLQNESATVTQGEKNLRKSIEDIYRLYLFELRALEELHTLAQEKIDRNKKKKLPTEEDLNPVPHFVENRFLGWLTNHTEYHRLLEKHHVAFHDNRDIIKGIFKEIEVSNIYQQYLQERKKPSPAEDKRLVKWIYGTYLVTNESLHQFYEEQSLHWADDLDAAQMMVAKTIKSFSEDTTPEKPLVSLYKDISDLQFGLELFRKTIINDDEYSTLIKEKALNWESERIAVVDAILLKMALAELVVFQEIPIKVTLNEYIELSKEYSTPKSGNFINGILDKLQEEMKAEGKIKKIGRGLL